MRWSWLTAAWTVGTLGWGSVSLAQTPSSQVDRYCGPNAAQIMILGTYHFANPGLDGRNVNADNVLTPKRQAELADLANRLAKFRPTKIMVEAPFTDTDVRDRYQRHLKGQYTLTHNETEQIGFRLGKMLGLPRINPVDYEMRMSGLRPDELNHAWRPKPPPAPAGAAVSSPPAAPQLTEEDLLLRRSTIRETLLRMNRPEQFQADHSRDYLPMLLPKDGPTLYEQSEYLVNWYKRNFRTFTNIARQTDFPSDRVLVITGGGHQKILRDLAIEADYFCLVETIPYLS